MGWLRLVGSTKLQVFFAEYRLFYRALLQKRPVILLVPLTEATPYVKHRVLYGILCGILCESLITCVCSNVECWEKLCKTLCIVWNIEDCVQFCVQNSHNIVCNFVCKIHTHFNIPHHHTKQSKWHTKLVYTKLNTFGARKVAHICVHHLCETLKQNLLAFKFWK